MRSDSRRAHILLWALLGLVAVWCVILPWVWAHNLSGNSGILFGTTLSVSRPGVLMSVLSATALAAVFARHRVAPMLFLVAGVAPIIALWWFGAASRDGVLVGCVLLLATATIGWRRWRSHAA